MQVLPQEDCRQLIVSQKYNYVLCCAGAAPGGLPAADCEPEVQLRVVLCAGAAPGGLPAADCEPEVQLCGQERALRRQEEGVQDHTHLQEGGRQVHATGKHH